MKILDTDVCIEILRGNEKVIERRREVDDDVATTWITASELAYGAEKSSASDRNLALVAEFLGTLPTLGLDLTSAIEFGRCKQSTVREPDPGAVQGTSGRGVVSRQQSCRSA